MNNSLIKMLFIAFLVAIVFIAVGDAQSVTVVAEGVELCDTGIKASSIIEEREGGNALVVFNKETNQIFIVAFDYGADGYYEVLVFDTDADGNADMQLEGGKADIDDVLYLYCGYQRIELSNLILHQHNTDTAIVENIKN